MSILFCKGAIFHILDKIIILRNFEKYHFYKKVWTFFIYEWIYLGPKYDTTQKSKYQKSVKSTFFCTFLGVLIWVVIVHKYFFPTTNSQKVIILPVFGLRIRHRLTIGSPCSYKQKLWLKIRFFFSYPPPQCYLFLGKGGSSQAPPRLFKGFLARHRRRIFWVPEMSE